MTVRRYETKLATCAICLEPHQECTTPMGGVGLELVVEGKADAFEVCESCVSNMARPFRIDGAQKDADFSGAIPPGTISAKHKTAIARQLSERQRQSQEFQDELEDALDAWRGLTDEQRQSFISQIEGIPFAHPARADVAYWLLKAAAK